MRLAVTWIAGAILIAVSAAARGSSKLPETQRPLPPIPSVTELEVVADLPSDYDASESPGSEAEFVVSLVSTPETLNESQRQVVEFWRAWRSQAVEALPEHLRKDSEHRKGIDETYRAAIANIGGVEGETHARGVLAALQYKVDSLRTRASLALLQAADLVASETTSVSVEALLVDLATVTQVQADE